ncbi:unnamed protein product [Rhodiola kirilowii]
MASHQGEEEQEHEVYGGEIPDEGEMDGDVDMSRAVEEEDLNAKELEDMKKRLKEIEEEAGALREMQAKVEKEMGAVQEDPSASATQAEKEEVDGRSVYVGNSRNISTGQLRDKSENTLRRGFYAEKISRVN